MVFNSNQFHVIRSIRRTDLSLPFWGKNVSYSPKNTVHTGAYPIDLFLFHVISLYVMTK